LVVVVVGFTPPCPHVHDVRECERCRGGRLFTAWHDRRGILGSWNAALLCSGAPVTHNQDQLRHYIGGSQAYEERMERGRLRGCFGVQATCTHHPRRLRRYSGRPGRPSSSSPTASIAAYPTWGKSSAIVSGSLSAGTYIPTDRPSGRCSPGTSS
jgi:hypothetical protein